MPPLAPRLNSRALCRSSLCDDTIKRYTLCLVPNVREFRMNHQDCQVFIGYRRCHKSANPTAQFLFDYLEAEFGEGTVFLDRETIPGGADFSDFISRKIERAKVFIALIDSSWLKNVNRLSIDGDWVRQEIEVALNCGLPIVPIRLDRETDRSFEITFPPDDLPSSIEKLKQFHFIDAGPGWEHELKRLVSDLKKYGVRSVGQTRIAQTYDRYLHISITYLCPATAATVLSQVVGITVNWLGFIGKDSPDWLSQIVLAGGVLVAAIVLIGSAFVSIYLPSGVDGIRRFLLSSGIILFGTFVFLGAFACASFLLGLFAERQWVGDGTIVLLMASVLASIQEFFHHRVFGGPPD